MSEKIEQATQTVDDMLRRRRDVMQIADCLAVSAVLKELQKQQQRVAELEAALNRLIETLEPAVNYIGVEVIWSYQDRAQTRKIINEVREVLAKGKE
jgi:oligoendopeptidase F